MFALHSLSHPEYMGRHNVGINLNIIFLTMPDKFFVTQQVMHEVRLVRIQPQFRNRDMDPSALRVIGIEIYHDNNNIGYIFTRLSETHEIIIFSVIKLHIPCILKGWIFFSYFIDPRNKVFKISFPVLFLGMEIFFLPLYCLLHKKFKRRPVYTII